MKKKWDTLAKTYEHKVLSLTSIPLRRKMILNSIKKGNVLNLGCGPTPYLNKDLIRQRNHVIASDYAKNMLKVSQTKFNHRNLVFVEADNTKLPFIDNAFDTVISVHSIVPDKRSDVEKMFNEIYRILIPKGKCIAFLPSFVSIAETAAYFHIPAKLDKKQKRGYDSLHWQCFHTPETIQQNMKRAGFKKYQLKKVFLNTKNELNQLKRIYGVDMHKKIPYTNYLIAIK